MRLSSRFDDALILAKELHDGQVRKGTNIPYIAHLLAVSSLVLENGGDEDEAIAALLHDAVEDQGGRPILDRIRRKFGDKVAAIVSDCTDAWESPKPPWRERKEDYLAKLQSKSRSSQLVSLADKTHNAGAILSDYLEIGDAVWERFNGGHNGTVWYYGALLDIFEKTMPGPLTRSLAESVAGFSGSSPSASQNR